MFRTVSKDLGDYHFSIRFDSESDVYEYNKDGGGECIHDVHRQLIQMWASDLGLVEGEDLFDFVEAKVEEGHGKSLVALIEKATTPKFSYMSGDEIEDLLNRGSDNS
jgi:hypothetical protein